MDTIDMMMKHIQDLRRSIPGKPSAATLAAWHLEDIRHDRQDEDDFTFDFTSEVKQK